MAINKTEALVLKNYKIRESSLIVSFFTRDFGKLSCVAKGIRRRDCRFGSRLTPFSLNQIVFYRSRRGMLHTLSECALREGFFPIREDVRKLAAASYFLELIDELTRWEDKNEPLFYLLLSCLKKLALSPYQEKLIRLFEIKSLVLAGFGPRLDACAGCGRPLSQPFRFNAGKGGLVCSRCFNRGTPADVLSPAAVEAIKNLKAKDIDENLSRTVSVQLEQEMREIVRKFLYFQIEKPLKSRAFLEKVGSFH